MSDFFRIHAPAEFSAKTIRQLASLVHDAEDSVDDVLLLQCWDELERRGTPMSVFMEFYRDLWRERMTP
jgi:hypothetical protein